MFKLEIQPSEMLHTKFGTVKINNNNGYYQVTTQKQGNHRKLWHRLIWEDVYGEICSSDYIHHKDGNRLNNCILNLEAINKSKHQSLHNLGKTVSDETKKKIGNAHRGKTISEKQKQQLREFHLGQKHTDETIRKMTESRNSSGYYRVQKCKDNKCKQGFIWKYVYNENGKYKVISRVNFDDLEREVKNRRLEWREL